MQATRKEPSVSVAVDPWMSVPAAAREIGVANATVLQLALRGEVKSQLVAGRTVIDRESVAAYKARSAGNNAAK